jgi:acyl-CoA synthetase (AMP-forming)/AMP-acid ligase II
VRNTAGTGIPGLGKRAHRLICEAVLQPIPGHMVVHGQIAELRELARTATGKVQKFKLRDEFQKLLLP